MSEHNCEQQDHFLSIAGFMGEIRADISNIKERMDKLDGVITDKLFPGQTKINNAIGDINIKLEGLKLKIVGIGMAGAVIFEVCLSIYKTMG